jgi:hypothetical protein
MNGLTWGNAGAAIVWSGLGLLILAMAAFGAGQWLRRVRDVMDTGDGQGGVPPIAGRLSDAEAPTQAISMRALAVNPAMEGAPCPQFCGNLAEVGDPASCGCGGPCGRAWCPRKRNPVPVTWGEREEGVR